MEGSISKNIYLLHTISLLHKSFWRQAKTVFIGGHSVWKGLPLLHIWTSLLASSLQDLWEPAVMYLHCRFWAWKWENDWDWEKTGSEGPHCLWLALAVSWWPLITAGSNQELTVIWCCHCQFETRTGGDKIELHKAGAVLSFLLSSIPSIEVRIWAAPSIVAAALHREAGSWIWKNGLIFLLKC